MFKYIKTLVFFLLLVIGIVGGIYWAGEKGKLANTPLKNFNHKKLNILRDEDVEQAKILSSRVQESGEHVQKVLGENIEAEEQKPQKSVQAKTLEYIRYVYCQQVVDDWNAKYNQSSEN